VIDMCPQANSSMMLLGGGKDGEQHLQSLISLETPRTVVGYIADVLTAEARPLSEYMVRLMSRNDQLPPNMYLLPGDGNLELIAPLLSERASTRAISQKDKPWERVHSIIRDVVDMTVSDGRSVTYFIDTNPSFSIYTELAILAAEHLLVPINADDSSIFAITGLFNLIFGSRAKHPVYENYTFAARIDSNGMRRPKIYLLLGNRFTQQKGAAHAFKALSNEATRKMYEEYALDPARFRSTLTKISDQSDFDREFTVELRDFNSAGVVAANQGIPLSRMDRNSYQVYGEDIQVSKEQRSLCKQTIEALVARL
jgi:cellulose biosynthesis protein BcsQ